MLSITEILIALKNTTSRKEKISILEYHQQNQILKELLFYTYNPYYNFYIKKIPKPSHFGFKSCEDSWKDFKLILDRLRNRNLSGKSALIELNKFFSEVDKNTFVIYQQVLKKKFSNLGINIKTINKVFKNLIPEFHIQLANRFDYSKLNNYPDYWYVSPKLDGIRAIYLFDKNGLYSRQGYRLIGFDAIEEECLQICKQFNLKFLDGELYSSDLDFDTIQSYVMKQKHFDEQIKHFIKFYLFALGDCKDTATMVTLLNDISLLNLSFTSVVPYEIVKNDLNFLVDKFLAFHPPYEGIMLRHPTISYDWKRSDKLLKFKHSTLLDIYENCFDSLSLQIQKKVLEYLQKYSFLILDDFIITGCLEGHGIFSNMLGALLVEGIYKGKKIKTKVGSGFDLEQRKHLWKIKETLIGKEVVIRCEEVTKNGSLRFPIIKEIKLDR